MTKCSAHIGTVVNTFGLKGEVKILLGPDFWDTAFDCTNLELVSRSGVRRGIEVVSYRFKGNTVIAKLSDISSIEEAENLIGSRIEIDVSLIEEEHMPEGILPCQAIGLEVIGADGSKVGVVVDVLMGHLQNCLIVETGDKRVPIPLVPQIVKSIDIERGFLEIDPPDGLMDLEY